MKYIIKAPNKSYNGTSASVSFRDGEGKTDSEHLADWFRKHGYEVIEEEVQAKNKFLEEFFDFEESENELEDAIDIVPEEKLEDVINIVSEEDKTAEMAVLSSTEVLKAEPEKEPKKTSRKKKEAAKEE